MTMPRKGSRKVVVAGTTYRFMVRKERPWRVSVTVEDEANPGRVLMVGFGENRCPGIGTAEVAAFIAHAKKTGWTPTAMGNFYMTDTAVDEALVGINR